MKCDSGFNDNAVGIKFVPTLRASKPSTIALKKCNTVEGEKIYIKRLEGTGECRCLRLPLC